jgi:hypothetical protein
MNKEIERAMREVIEAWECPDSPETSRLKLFQLFNSQNIYPIIG